MTRKRVVNIIIDFIIMCLLVVADQYTKALAVVQLKDKPAIPIIPGILEFNYLENRGAAFGMMQNQKIFFIFVAVIILGCIIYIFVKTPPERKYTILHILLTFIAAGAVGNMIDRLNLNYVVDFIYIKAINFPIFNVADIYVTCATFLLVIILLFVYKDQDLRFLNLRSDKFRTFKDKNNETSGDIAADTDKTSEDKSADADKASVDAKSEVTDTPADADKTASDNADKTTDDKDDKESSDKEESDDNKASDDDQNHRVKDRDSADEETDHV